jgi:hypothetical protein
MGVYYANLSIVQFRSMKLGIHVYVYIKSHLNSLNAELNPICHLLSLLGAHHIFHVSKIRVNIIFAFMSSSSKRAFVLLF